MELGGKISRVLPRLLTSPFLSPLRTSSMKKQYGSASCCAQVSRFISLVNIDAEAVSASALDVTALRCLAEASPFAKLIALSNLHAKVFVVDEKAAIVTSGNLTRSALDSNLEYGVLFQETDLVQTIRKDMLSFARLGSQVDTNTIVELASLETELRFARANITSSTTPDAKRRFAKVMRQARPVLASLQVGKRSAHAVFGEAIQSY